MAAINFPSSPALNDTYTAENGLIYQWDGVKWIVYVTADSSTNWWQRDSGTSTIKPLSPGDDLVLESGVGADTVTIVGESGNITTLGAIAADHFDIESLPSLP